MLECVLNKVFSRIFLFVGLCLFAASVGTSSLVNSMMYLMFCLVCMYMSLAALPEQRCDNYFDSVKRMKS